MNAVVQRTARFPVLLGVLIGLIVSVGALTYRDLQLRQEGGLHRGPLLSECDGRLRRLVLHYTREAAHVVLPVYGSFLSQMPPEVCVHVVCPSQADYEDFLRRIGPHPCQLLPVVVDHPITTWSRDRWLALNPGRDGKITLVCPSQEEAAGIWPAREGDQRVALDLANALAPSVTAERSDLFFDGGDFAADSETVFVRPTTLSRNLQRTVASPAEWVERLAGLLQRRVVLLEGAPDHHVAMYLMPVGNRTVVVGDPRQARDLLTRDPGAAAACACLLTGADFSKTTLARFDAVAEQCQALGYRVVRIPLVPGQDGRAYLTYVNAILDQRDGMRLVYLPCYRGADSLNHAAVRVWHDLGFVATTVDCTACVPHGGTLHCLVNVLERGGL